MPGWQSGHRIYPELQWLGQGSLCPRTGHFYGLGGMHHPLGQEGEVCSENQPCCGLCPVGRGLDGKRKLESEKECPMEGLTSLGSGGVSGWPGPPPGSSECVHQQPGGHLPTDQITSSNYFSSLGGQDSGTGLMLIQGQQCWNACSQRHPSQLLNSGLGARNALSVHGSHII